MNEIYDKINQYVFSTLTGETSLTTGDIVAVFVIALILGLYIFGIYRHQAKSEFYSKDFNVTLPGLTIVTAGIMIAMQANLLVSLGMVGSLSIVRFRTAVKSPIDLLYLFWSIAVGIICGVGLYSLAVLLCLTVTLVLLGMRFIGDINTTNLLVITAKPETEIKKIESVIHQFAKKSKQSSMMLKNEQAEYIYELFSSDMEKLAGQLRKIKGVCSVNVISHIGDRRF